MNINDLITGDIILISNYENGLFNYFLDMIRYGTHSEYVHIGIIVKDPNFTKKNLKGIYLWESSYEGTKDPEDDKVKLGVQLTNIEDVIKNYNNANYFVRRLQDNSMFTNEKLAKIHDVVYNKPYDINPCDWIGGLFRYDFNPQRTNNFWCSAFVGYILTQLEILKEDTDWSILRPCDFALDGENLKYNTNNKLEPLEYKLIVNS